MTVRTQRSTFHFPYMVCLRLGVHLSIPKADVHINPLQRTFRDLDSPRVCEAKCPANLKPRRLQKRGLKEPPPTSLLCLNSLKSRNSKRRSTWLTRIATGLSMPTTSRICSLLSAKTLKMTTWKTCLAKRVGPSILQCFWHYLAKKWTEQTLKMS